MDGWTRMFADLCLRLLRFFLFEAEHEVSTDSNDKLIENTSIHPHEVTSGSPRRLLIFHPPLEVSLAPGGLERFDSSAMVVSLF
jgi:hypothetical protein